MSIKKLQLNKESILILRSDPTEQVEGGWTFYPSLKICPSREWAPNCPSQGCTVVDPKCMTVYPW